MGYNTKGLLMFIVGVAIGSVTTWKLVETKYKQIANEEIDDMKEYYDRKLNEIGEGKEIEEIDEEEEEPFIEEDKDEYKDIVKKYHSDSDHISNKPYVIEPSEFGGIEDYDQINLTYYADGVVVDDLSGEVVEDLEKLIGLNLDRIGEYEDDALHIRNDELETDYEILAVENKYKEE